MRGALWRVTKQTASAGPTRYPPADSDLPMWFYKPRGDMPGHQTIMRNNTAVYLRQGVQSSATDQDERPAGQLSQRQDFHRPDCKAAHHPRAIMQMELPYWWTLLIMRWRLPAWKLLRHYGALEKITCVIINSCVDWRAEWSMVANDRCRSSKDRSETRMPAVTLPMPNCRRQGVEDIHSPEGKWNSVDTLDPTWWPALCRWSGSPLPYPVTDEGDDKQGCGGFSPSWSEGLQG